MLVLRLASAAMLIGLIIVSLFSEWVFNLAIIFFTILGLYEFFCMLEKKGIKIYKYFGVFMGVLIPLSIMARFESTKRWEFLFIVLTLLALLLMQFKRRQSSGVLIDISTTLFGILYVSWLFSFLIKIRYLPAGAGLFASLLLITKSGDIGAYLLGVRFGRIPLVPHISPKKTWEGAIAGIVFSILAALAVQPVLNFSYPHLIALGFFIAILGQLGDLSESLIKRDCGVKDSGSILPGMGGILDEVDSLLFTAPVFYFYVSTIMKT